MAQSVPCSTLTNTAYSEALAARTATPAGGSTAAIVASHAAALVSMVVRFTQGAARYAHVGELMARRLEESEALRQTLLALADDDVAAFDGVVAARAMPKSSPEAVDARRAAVQTAMKGATATPLAIAEGCLAVMRLVEAVAAYVNPTVLGDAATALFLANGALQSSLLNVRINLRSLQDPDFVAAWAARADALEAEVATVYAAAQLACEAALNQS